MLRSLFLNHNRIVVIDAIENLKSLKQLGLFHNQVMGGQDVIRVLKSLPKLRELSLDINPCSSDAGFNYEVLLTLEKLKMFNDEAVRELDRDIARQFFKIQGLPAPDEPKPHSALSSKDHAMHDKENI